MSEIVGRVLTSVVFIHDYIQFVFDGPCLTTLTLPSILTTDGELRHGERGYCDCLCSQIGAQVKTTCSSSEEVKITFGNDVAIAVSLREEDYTGPEAINYVGDDGNLIVV